jgi:serine phosphatase RsbU (regulator of sigma subunit)
VIARPSGSTEGGDLYALFSCAGERVARIVLADCVGHGFDASQIAAHVHKLIHQFRDIPDSSRLLAALNDEFTVTGQTPGGPLRLSTVVTATFHRDSGEFNYAYAGHPRMMLWRVRDRRWWTLGEGLEGPPIGFICGELYIQQSIRMERGDIVLAFSDGATDVFSEDGRFLGHKGLLHAASESMAALPPAVSLTTLGESLARAISRFHGSDDLSDDFTLLTLRRP